MVGTTDPGYPRISGTNVFLHYFGKVTFGCTAGLKRGTIKCSQNGLGLMIFALFRKSKVQLHCGTGKRNREVLPERSGTNAFLHHFGKVTFSCTAELERGTGKCSHNGLGLMLFCIIPQR